jgi:hypothetical protein
MKTNPPITKCKQAPEQQYFINNAVAITFIYFMFTKEKTVKVYR